MSRHRAPDESPAPVRAHSAPALQVGITERSTVVSRRPLPPVPSVVTR